MHQGEGLDVQRIRRLIVVTSLTLTGAILFPSGVASAASGTCPPTASGFTAYPVVGSVGDPAPTLGVDPLWDLVASSAAEEGLTLEDLVDYVAADSLDELYAFVVAGWLGVDTNGDRMICVQRFPRSTKNHPAFIWNVIDNKAHVPA